MAESDGKIYITISDRRFGSNVAEADEQNKIDKEKSASKESNVSKFVRHRFFNLIEQQTMQAVNYTVNNIGNFTGDYITQSQVSEAMQIGGFLLNIATATVAGAKMGGPVGAVIGLLTVPVTKGISMYYQGKSIEVQMKIQNREIAQLRTRAGLNSLNNDSRGTEY